MLTQNLVCDLQALGYAAVSHTLAGLGYAALCHTLAGYCLNVNFGCGLPEYFMLHSTEKQQHSILLELCHP